MLATIQAAMTSMVSVMNITKGAIEARDWAKLTEVSAQLNDQVMKAQQAVFVAQSANLDLCAQMTNATKELAELRATLAQQARHHIEEVAPGKFALRVEHPRQDEQNLLIGSNSQPKHYACQRCFAVTGKSIVLQFYAGCEVSSATYTCPECRGVLEVV